jgi:sugar phosphate isomerase/epimerase
MRGWPIAVRLESVGKPFREALETAARLGFQGVEFDAVGDLSPASLTQTGRREVQFLLRRHGLRLVALGFPTRRGYEYLDRLDVRIEATVAAMLLAYDLGAGLIINQLGIIPPAEDEAKRMILRESLSRLSNEGDRVGARIAFQTGSDSPAALAELLGSVANSGLAINLAPASLATAGEDLEGAIEKLAPWIAGVHVRDIVRSPLASAGVREVAMGEGEIDWRRLLRVLDMVDGCRHLTIVREPAAGSEAAISKAKGYVESLIG